MKSIYAFGFLMAATVLIGCGSSKACPTGYAISSDNQTCRANATSSYPSRGYPTNGGGYYPGQTSQMSGGYNPQQNYSYDNGYSNNGYNNGYSY